MVDLQASEHREPPGVIPELLTELPCSRIGSADFGVAIAFGREQGGTKRHLQIQLTPVCATAFGSKFGSKGSGCVLARSLAWPQTKIVPLPSSRLLVMPVLGHNARMQDECALPPPPQPSQRQRLPPAGSPNPRPHPAKSVASSAE